MNVVHAPSGNKTMPLVGIGVYAPTEASRLIRIPVARIRRWLRGYKYRSAGTSRTMPPLWEPQIRLPENGLYLGFRDLIELRIADAFIREGVSPQYMRQAIAHAREIIGDDHPLSTARFRTDGRTIFLDSLEAAEDEPLLDILRKQYAFKRILEPLLKDIEFDRNVPVRWWPDSPRRGIVIDPQRSFGQPVDDGSGIPTTILHQAAKTEGSPEAAATAYGVRIAAVRNAITFEERLVA